MKKETIHIVATGGTIEKVYYDGIMIHESSSVRIEKMIARLHLPNLDYKIHRIMNKDSLYLNNEDRQIIKDNIQKIMQAAPGPVIVIHGTDTMVETGLYLKKQFVHLDTAIVLTGAMVPFGFEESDSIQNFTESLLAARLLNPGVYIVFHGTCFPIDNVRKNKEILEFEYIHD